MFLIPEVLSYYPQAINSSCSSYLSGQVNPPPPTPLPSIVKTSKKLNFNAGSKGGGGGSPNLQAFPRVLRGTANPLHSCWTSNKTWAHDFFFLRTQNMGGRVRVLAQIDQSIQKVSDLEVTATDLHEGG